MKRVSAYQTDDKRLHGSKVDAEIHEMKRSAIVVFGEENSKLINRICNSKQNRSIIRNLIDLIERRDNPNFRRGYFLDEKE